MISIQAESKNFLGIEEVPQIGSAVILAGVTITLGVKRSKISGILGILYHYPPLAGE
jgi:hypothetical protein